MFYVSNAAGWISLLSADGKLLAPRWAGGLRSPKGLALSGGTLYAADVDAVASIDVVYAKVVRRAPVPGALSLCGLAAGRDGAVYVSDTRTNKVHRVAADGSVGEAAAGPWVEGPGGLFLKGRRLYVAAWGQAAPDLSTKVPGRLYFIDLRAGSRRDVSAVPLGNLGGLALESGFDWKDPAGWLSGDAWLVTDQPGGKLYRVGGRSGEPALLLEGLRKPSGLDYDPKRRLAVVALTGEDAVAAWDLSRFPR